MSEGPRFELLQKQNDALAEKVDRQNSQILEIRAMMKLLLSRSDSGSTTDASSTTFRSRSSTSTTGPVVPSVESRTGEYTAHAARVDKVWRESTIEQFEDDMDDEQAFVSICEEFPELNAKR